MTPAPCATLPSVVVSGFTYTSAYSGSFYTEDSGNPAVAGGYGAPLTSTISGTVSACAAIQSCASLAYSDPGTYDAIDLHYMLPLQEWLCVQYYDPAPSPVSQYFTNYNTDAVQVYGYDT